MGPQQPLPDELLLANRKDFREPPRDERLRGELPQGNQAERLAASEVQDGSRDVGLPEAEWEPHPRAVIEGRERRLRGALHVREADVLPRGVAVAEGLPAEDILERDACLPGEVEVLRGQELHDSGKQLWRQPEDGLVGILVSSCDPRRSVVGVVPSADDVVG